MLWAWVGSIGTVALLALVSVTLRCRELLALVSAHVSPTHHNNDNNGNENDNIHNDNNKNDN